MDNLETKEALIEYQNNDIDNGWNLKDGAKIPLTIEKKKLYMENESFEEYIDPNCFNTLVNSGLYKNEYDNNKYSQKQSSKIYSNIKDQLDKYFYYCFKEESIIFKVYYVKPKHRWGRVFPSKSLGLTCFPKKIRNTLIKDNYIDLDISNAQPSILYNICISNDIPCPILTEYINNRENILKEVIECFKVSRDDAKTLFLRLSFFGTVDGWCSDLNIKKSKCKFVNNYVKELTVIATEIKNKNKELYDTARRQNTSNPIGSFFSLYLQEYETRIMDCVIMWIVNETPITRRRSESNVLTYEFDGLKLLKEKVIKYGLDRLINNLNQVVKQRLGFDITFEEKPIIDFYDIKYEPFDQNIVERQKIEEKLNDYKQTITDQDEYVYDDYKLFINKELTYEFSDILPDGVLFKKYYKQVFARIDCGGITKYFSKNKKDGFIHWTLLQSIPFGEKTSTFNYINIKQITKNIKVPLIKPINIFFTNLEVEDMTIFKTLEFIPYLHEGTVDTDIFNLFTGFKYKALIDEAPVGYYDNIKPILEHLKEVLCSGQVDIYNYIIFWLAHMIQKPCDKAGVPVILMKSEQGAGKNLFWDFMGSVMGIKYIVTINDLDDLTNKFNTRTEGKLLTILNEIQNYGGSYKNNEKLKSILTDVRQTIEPKGKESYEINNFSRSVMLTNNDWAAKISNDDRRYLPVDVSNHKKGDNEYFKNLADIINDDKNAELFFHYLTQVDISDFNVRTIPHTQLKENMKWFNTENRPLYFLKEYIDFDEITKITTKNLFEAYEAWCFENKERQTFSQRTFTQQITKYGFNYIQFKVDYSNQRGFVISKPILKLCIEKTLRIENFVFE